MDPIFIYLCLVNAAGFLLMLIDKQKAIKNRWRIPERTLLGIAVFGGSVGCYLGMQLFRHKTRHAQFYIGIPVIMAMQIVGGILIYSHFM